MENRVASFYAMGSRQHRIIHQIQARRIPLHIIGNRTDRPQRHMLLQTRRIHRRPVRNMDRKQHISSLRHLTAIHEGQHDPRPGLPTRRLFHALTTPPGMGRDPGLHCQRLIGQLLMACRIVRIRQIHLYGRARQIQARRH